MMSSILVVSGLFLAVVRVRNSVKNFLILQHCFFSLMVPGNRRSKIRPPRKSLISSSLDSSSSPDLVDYEKLWSILANAINQIQCKNVSNLSYEQLYRKAYMLVVRKYGGKLYENVGQLILQHLLTRRDHLLAINDDEEFMNQVLQEWEDHLQSMKFISDILVYLNRVYIKESKKLLIYDLGIQIFKTSLIKYNDNEIGLKIIQMILNEYTKARNGQVITTKSYITKSINMMELLLEKDQDLQLGDNYYQQYFEPQFFNASELFFNQFINKLPKNGLVYLDSIHQLIKDEESKMYFHIPFSSHAKLITLINNILIKNNVDVILKFPLNQQGLSYLLEPVINNILQDKSDDQHLGYLKKIYQLIGRIDSNYQLLRVRLKESIISQGSILTDYIKNSLENSKKISVNSPTFATKWIEALLKYKNQFNIISTQSFDSNPIIEQTIIFSMRDFINNLGKIGVNAPEILSIYMDYQIKQINKSSKDFTSDPINDLINKSLTFLKFIKDKDAFEAHYANHFAKRFLNSKIASQSINFNNKLGVNIEELLISKLCEEMGASSLDKIIKMNKDIKLSKDTTKYWKKHLQTNQLNLIDLDLKICNVLDWPKSMTKDYKFFDEDPGFIWLSQLRPTMREFEEFWNTDNKNSNKSLFWSPKFGSIDLRITYPSQTYEINLATYAGIIMLLFAPQSIDSDGAPTSAFDENRELTYEEIKELTGIPEQDLKRHLQSIAVAPRSRLLIKIPMTKDVNELDKFKLNSKFKSPSIKVKVLTVSASSSSKKLEKTDAEIENDAVKQNITEGRKIEVNAAIVRIMKSRHTLKHNELIEELIKQLANRFQPPVILIKQRIEDLIEKEYLKRDDDDRNVYHYLA